MKILLEKIKKLEQLEKVADEVEARYIEASNNKLELSADDSRMLNILSNFGLY